MSYKLQTVYVKSKSPEKFFVSSRRGVHTLYQSEVKPISGYLFTPEELNKLKRGMAEDFAEWLGKNCCIHPMTNKHYLNSDFTEGNEWLERTTEELFTQYSKQ